jgi:hypothetical protein
MNKNIITFLVLLLSSSTFFSQDFKLNRVTVEELAEKVHPLDSTAAAAYLYKAGQVYFQLSEGRFYLMSEVTAKIKIYKKEGYDYATVQVPYYTGGQTVRIYFEDAATFNLVGNKVERTKLKSDGEFEEKINENYSGKKIVLPNVKEGSIVEYKYTLRTPYITFFPDWYFQHQIPVNNVKFDVLIPEYFKYQVFLKGFEDIVRSAETVVPGFNSSYNQSRVIYTGTNIKAIKAEPYVNNMDNYTSMMQYELATTNFPGKGYELYSTDWPSVTKTIYESDSFGNELDKKSYFEKDLDVLLNGVNGRDERIMLIFNHVKSRMNWNERFGYFTDLGVKKAYSEKVGNVADINLMLVAMLRYAQINTNPILVSTRGNGISLFPNRGAFNYVIAGVEFDNGQVVLLDATSKNAMPNILPIRVLNWTGQMIRTDKTSQEIDLMPQINSKEAVSVIAKMDATGIVKGSVRDQYFDYKSFVFRENHQSMSKDAYLEKLENKYKGLQIEKYDVANTTDLNKPVSEIFDFTNDNTTERIGDKMYFSPMLFYTSTVNPFKQEVRKFPLDFSFPYQEKYNFTITIPEGYEIESMPQSINIAIEENIGGFKYMLASAGNQIQVSVVMEINYANIAADYYNALKTFFGQVVDKQKEKIVLKKI